MAHPFIVVLLEVAVFIVIAVTSLVTVVIAVTGLVTIVVAVTSLVTIVGFVDFIAVGLATVTVTVTEFNITIIGFVILEGSGSENRFVVDRGKSDEVESPLLCRELDLGSNLRLLSTLENARRYMSSSSSFYTD